jgi:tRNA threonylcarbamoyladenosine biosynthesis protein TsaE
LPASRPAGGGRGEPVSEAAVPLCWEVVLPTAADTRRLGERLGAVLRAGDLILLGGPLGAGKTALTQGIGAGLGVTSAVVSPTFVIARVHEDGRIPLIHVDAYRMGGLGDIDDLDLDATAQDSVTVVEWGAGMVERLSEAYLRIDLRRDEESDTRTATIGSYGGDWAHRLDELSLPRREPG